MNESIENIQKMQKLFQTIVIAESQRLNAQDVWLVKRISSDLEQFKTCLNLLKNAPEKARRSPHVKEALDKIAVAK